MPALLRGPAVVVLALACAAGCDLALCPSGPDGGPIVDTTPPVIDSIIASPSTLWPPDHKLVPVSISVSATDSCHPSSSCRIVSVSANEPVLGPGSGNTDPDWIVTDPGPSVSPALLGVELRAERAGGGTGRVYRIDTTCADASGNTTAGATTVTVPHDQGH